MKQNFTFIKTEYFKENWTIRKITFKIKKHLIVTK